MHCVLLLAWTVDHSTPWAHKGNIFWLLLRICKVALCQVLRDLWVGGVWVHLWWCVVGDPPPQGSRQTHFWGEGCRPKKKEKENTNNRTTLLFTIYYLLLSIMVCVCVCVLCVRVGLRALRRRIGGDHLDDAHLLERFRPLLLLYLPPLLVFPEWGQCAGGEEDRGRLDHGWRRCGPFARQAMPPWSLLLVH